MAAGHGNAAVRDTELREKLRDKKAAVAGLGGLGSNIAVMLARAGVGRLLLVDHDTVEESNLNRQHYGIRHIGMLKTDALAEQIKDIAPSVRTELRSVRVTEENAAGIFKGYPIVCEAFDDPLCKAALVNTLLSDGDVMVVAASGMAGLGSTNDIITRKMFRNLYLCGDMTSAAEDGTGSAAPRVAVCAGHQANTVLRILTGLEG